MDGAVLTIGNLLTLLGVGGGVVGAVVNIGRMIREAELKHVNELKAMAAEASASRAKLYERVDAIRSEMGQIYVRKDVHDAEYRQLLAVLEENSRVVCEKIDNSELKRKF